MYKYYVSSDKKRSISKIKKILNKPTNRRNILKRSIPSASNVRKVFLSPRILLLLNDFNPTNLYPNPYDNVLLTSCVSFS